MHKYPTRTQKTCREPLTDSSNTALFIGTDAPPRPLPPIRRSEAEPKYVSRQVTDRVEDRTSFLANVIYAVFPNRLLRYDYSYMFEYAFHAFTMAKPALKPRWQSLYYPLTDGVWASILAVVIIMPLPLILVKSLLYCAKNEKKCE